MAFFRAICVRAKKIELVSDAGLELNSAGDENAKTEEMFE